MPKTTIFHYSGWLQRTNLAKKPKPPAKWTSILGRNFLWEVWVDRTLNGVSGLKAGKHQAKNKIRVRYSIKISKLIIPAKHHQNNKPNKTEKLDLKKKFKSEKTWRDLCKRERRGVKWWKKKNYNIIQNMSYTQMCIFRVEMSRYGGLSKSRFIKWNFKKNCRSQL